MSCRPASKRRRGDDIKEQIYLQLRQVQRITGCSSKTLDVVLERLQPFLKGCEDATSLKMPRVRARKKSDIKKLLHGCVGCDGYVFGPDNDETVCPKCGDNRYTVDGKPREVRLSAYKLFFFDLLICVIMQACWYFLSTYELFFVYFTYPFAYSCRRAGTSSLSINLFFCFFLVLLTYLRIYAGVLVLPPASSTTTTASNR